MLVKHLVLFVEVIALPTLYAYDVLAIIVAVIALPTLYVLEKHAIIVGVTALPTLYARKSWGHNCMGHIDPRLYVNETSVLIVGS